MLTKAELRQEIRNRKRQFSQEDLGELSLDVLSRLLQHPGLQKAHTLLLYYSLPDEVNTHEMIDELLNQGKQIWLPKVVDEETLEIREYSGKKDLREGMYHIMEPVGRSISETEYSQLDLAFIPGMAFDSQGHRLGRGKGYYDRFLSQIPPGVTKIGVCFDFQKVETVPVDSNDIPMDEVI